MVLGTDLGALYERLHLNLASTLGEGWRYHPNLQLRKPSHGVTENLNQSQTWFSDPASLTPLLYDDLEMLVVCLLLI